MRDRDQLTHVHIIEGPFACDMHDDRRSRPPLIIRRELAVALWLKFGEHLSGWQSVDTTVVSRKWIVGRLQARNGRGAGGVYRI